MFFQPSSFKERTISMDHFKEWSGAIANSYFNAGIPPTESLQKIAQQEGLVPHHVEVLAAEVNKEIHKHKYAAAEDKYFAADFPLADARKVIAGLQADRGEVKVASALPEPVLKPVEIDVFAAFGVSPEQMDKTAELKSEMKIAGEKVALVAQAATDKVILAEYAFKAAEGNFIKKARHYVLEGGNSGERMQRLGDLEHFAKCANLRDVALKPLAKVAYVLGNEGLLSLQHTKTAVQHFIKTADVTAPEELISKWLPAQIVNGEHPLYITLKTVKTCKDDLEDSRQQSKLIHDKLHILKQRVRAL